MRTALPSRRLPCSLAAALLALAAAPGCTEDLDYGDEDAGTSVIPGLAYADIGTLCSCDLVVDNATGLQRCASNPTNTCPKAGMTCVIATPDANANNAGNGLWEGPLFSVGRMAGTGSVVVEGECTILGTPARPPACPTGTVGITVSSGATICKRTCQSDQECGRADWVCDTPLLDRNGIDMDPAAERGLDLKLCRPRCVSDFPDCNRSTPCTMGRPGCYRSALTRNAPGDLGIYVGDRNGARVCHESGHCQAVAGRNPLAGVGSPCASHADCAVNFLCVSGPAYGAPDGLGFCTYADCDPNAAAGQVGACVPGLTCERAFEMGMCFPDCASGTICNGGAGQMCGQAAPAMIYNYDPATGAPVGWKQNQCVDCALTGMCP